MPATATQTSAWLSEDTVDDLIKETSSGNYVKVSKLAENADNKFRFFGKGITGFECWNVDNKPVRYRQMPDPSELPANIRTNDDGSVDIKRFIAGIVWDYQDEKFKILQLTQKKLMGALFGYMKDDEYGDPVNYDIKLTRKGSGLDIEYGFKVGIPKPPSKDLQDAFAELNVDLEKMFDGEDPFAS